MCVAKPREYRLPRGSGYARAVKPAATGFTSAEGPFVHRERMDCGGKVLSQEAGRFAGHFSIGREPGCACLERRTGRRGSMRGGRNRCVRTGPSRRPLRRVSQRVMRSRDSPCGPLKVILARTAACDESLERCRVVVELRTSGWHYVRLDENAGSRQDEPGLSNSMSNHRMTLAATRSAG